MKNRFENVSKKADKTDSENKMIKKEYEIHGGQKTEC